MRNHVALLCGTVLLLAASAHAQAVQQTRPTDISSTEPTRAIQELRLKDGSVLYGYVDLSEPDRIVFKTLAGTTLEVDPRQIASLEPGKGQLVNGEFLPADPNQTRLFFAPTGRSLQRGEAYVGVYQFMLPFVQVGVTDRISVGAGTPLIFGGGGDRPFWVTPKAQLYQRGAVSAAVGIMHFMNIGDGNFGIAYAVTTYGGSDNALTGGVGYAYARYDGEREATMIGMVGGEHRLSRRVKVVTENYFWQGAGIASLGVRFLGDRLSADVGLLTPIGGGFVFALPVVNFVWKF